ncbi:uncharacterized protein LOC121981907 [Zingiber officinale]|uniref:uncharacterized protein LOC121981907 n=1 Tax=Zingiber officinale TaxID=94328 RepID=UPI001C4C3076|nr:uncharacterized protein LOC121981907 [Zingiber officinale]
MFEILNLILQNVEEVVLKRVCFFLARRQRTSPSPQRTAALRERTDKACATFPALPKATTSPHRHFPKLAPPSTGHSLPILSHHHRRPHRLHLPPLRDRHRRFDLLSAAILHQPRHRCCSRPTTANPLTPPRFYDRRNPQRYSFSPSLFRKSNPPII